MIVILVFARRYCTQYFRGNPGNFQNTTIELSTGSLPAGRQGHVNYDYPSYGNGAGIIYSRRHTNNN